MKRATLVVNAPYDKNEIFRAESPLNRDGCLEFFHELKKELAKIDVDLATQDVHPIDSSDYVVYNEMPRLLPAKDKHTALLVFESELIRPDNWDLERHQAFQQIFTWNDTFVDRKKYFKFNFTHSAQTKFIAFKDKTAFCTLIAGNKRIEHPLELYSERIKTIRWFESHYPDHFEFYGVGWDKATVDRSLWSRIRNRIPFLATLNAETWPSYRGKVSSKLETLSQYKFSICYENARDIPGYITEKIFDSLAAGCLPVYWGAPNIHDFVPKACFIDRRDFNTHEALFTYLKQMSADEYAQRQSAILSYLKSEQHKQFEARFCAAQLVKDILGLA